MNLLIRFQAPGETGYTIREVARIKVDRQGVTLFSPDGTPEIVPVTRLESFAIQPVNCTSRVA